MHRGDRNRSVKREVQDLDPAVMAESAAVDSEAEASAVAVEATVSSQREENLTKYKR